MKQRASTGSEATGAAGSEPSHRGAESRVTQVGDDAEVALAVDDVSKRFGDIESGVLAVDDVSFSI